MFSVTNIEHAINEIIKLSSAEKKSLLSFLRPKKLARNESLLAEGDFCDFIAFINKGVLIYYKTLSDGSEVTTDFAFSGDWVTDNLSRLTRARSNINIKALEETEIVILKNDLLDNLYKKHIKLERIGRILMEQAYLKLVQLSIDLQILSAKERYLKLLGTNPEIMQRVPLHHIADYLGIAPKSLSRIRKEITK